MDDTSTGLRGMGESFKLLKESFMALAEDRIALAKVEAQQEKYRLIQIFIWISAAIVTGMLAITFASLTLLYLFRHSAPIAVLGGLAGAYALAVVLIIVGFKRLVAKHPIPFPEPEAETEERDA
jgi:uncharacterized membrane protein YqjE